MRAALHKVELSQMPSADDVVSLGVSPKPIQYQSQHVPTRCPKCGHDLSTSAAMSKVNEE